jgi:hypothetical protein
MLPFACDAWFWLVPLSPELLLAGGGGVVGVALGVGLGVSVGMTGGGCVGTVTGLFTFSAVGLPLAGAPQAAVTQSAAVTTASKAGGPNLRPGPLRRTTSPGRAEPGLADDISTLLR